MYEAKEKTHRVCLVCETQMTLQIKDSVPLRSLFVRILLTSENPNRE
jgi:hypothetical protein